MMYTSVKKVHKEKKTDLKLNLQLFYINTKKLVYSMD